MGWIARQFLNIFKNSEEGCVQYKIGRVDWQRSESDAREAERRRKLGTVDETQGVDRHWRALSSPMTIVQVVKVTAQALVENVGSAQC